MYVLESGCVLLNIKRIFLNIIIHLGGGNDGKEAECVETKLRSLRGLKESVLQKTKRSHPHTDL